MFITYTAHVYTRQCLMDTEHGFSLGATYNGNSTIQPHAGKRVTPIQSSVGGPFYRKHPNTRHG